MTLCLTTLSLAGSVLSSSPPPVSGMSSFLGLGGCVLLRLVLV